MIQATKSQRSHEQCRFTMDNCEFVNCIFTCMRLPLTSSHGERIRTRVTHATWPGTKNGDIKFTASKGVLNCCPVARCRLVITMHHCTSELKVRPTLRRVPYRTRIKRISGVGSPAELALFTGILLIRSVEKKILNWSSIGGRVP